MEFFYHIKATQKSGKQDAVIWFTAKSEARAALTLDVALEDVGIETGRGKDYSKPIRTDMPVINDLPEEGSVCFEFCKRYALADDQRTWNVIPSTAPQDETAPTPATTSDAALPATTETSTDTVNAGKTSLLENRTPAVRFAVHLLGDKYLSEISQEQQIVANELAIDEGHAYFQNLLLAKNDVADIGDLSLHAEWKLVQAVKDVFPQDKEHEPAQLAAFMSSWIEAEAGDRNQLVDDWKSGKLPATPEDEGGTTSENVHDAVREFRERELPALTTVATLPFRQRLLAQYIADKQYFYHVDEEQKKAILELELDVDNSYVQNMILAAENVDGFKKAHEPDIWKVVNALKTIFPVDGKRTELSVVIQFFKAWFSTEHIDRGILTREWTAGNRISNVQRTDAGTNADGGYVTDRGGDAHHTLDTLDLEIACALLPMDFHHFEIPSSVLRRAKEIVANKEEPWKSWSKILRNQSGVLAVNRAAIFNLVRIAPENIHLTPVAHLEFVNQTMTAEFNAATELLPLPSAQPDETQTAEEHPLPKWAEAGEQQIADESEAETHTLPKWANAATSQPQVANLGGGMFSIDGLMNEKQPENDDRSPVNEETTSDVQMEETNPAEGENSDAVSPGEGVDATAAQTDAVAGTICTGCGTEGGGGCPDCGAVAGDATYAVMEAGLKEELEALGADTSKSETMFTHLMVDLETMGKKPGAPIVSVGAVFFDPASGKTGAEYYQVINLESSMSFGARPDASTILWWLKQSPEARSAIVVDDTVGLVEALEQFLDFIAENAANGSKNVQLWGNGSSFDCSLLEAAFELADTPFPIPHWNYRDVRTVVELGKAVGLNSRYDIPFEGDQHNALADARHQVKYVSAIWQRLTAI